MHPDGWMDEATYALIGEAYAEVEEREPWLDNVTSVADIAILSEEAVSNYYGSARITHSRGANADAGAVRVMLEGKYLFDVIDTEEPFGKYRLVILPDRIRLDEKLAAKCKAFCAAGGKILCTGESGLTAEGDAFALDLGAAGVSPSAFRPVYFRPKFDLGVLRGSAFVI